MPNPSKTLLLAALAAALLTSPAAARTLFFDDFNGENAGEGAQDYASFANFDLEGSTDLVTASQAGFGDGAFVALDTTGANAAVLTSKQSFAFQAGEIVTLSALAAGSQGAGLDQFFMIFDFVGGAHVTDITATGGFGAIGLGEVNTIGINTAPAFIDPQSGFSTYAFSFRALDAGALRFSLFGSPVSGDPQGPRGRFAAHESGMLIDNVRLTAETFGGPVPEPGVWSLMVAGFGLAGATLRRRRAARPDRPAWTSPALSTGGVSAHCTRSALRFRRRPPR